MASPSLREIGPVTRAGLPADRLSFRGHLTYLDRYRLVVCNRCQVAVLLKKLGQHLRGPEHGQPASYCIAAQQWATSLPGPAVADEAGLKALS
jgi:hypothetical protein